MRGEKKAADRHTTGSNKGSGKKREGGGMMLMPKHFYLKPFTARSIHKKSPGSEKVNAKNALKNV